MTEEEQKPLTTPRKGDLAAEGNVVAACSIFVAAIVFDALNALPTAVVADVPVSLRTTSLILVALVAAPPVESHFLFEQRGLACVLLAIAAWVGLHHGGPNARVADATYTLGGGLASILIYGVVGPKSGEAGHDAKGRRENVVALCSAFLGYAGLRIVRASVSHATEVVQFSLSADDVETRGYALADDLVASVLGFGGVVCICGSIVILMNHDLIYEHGCLPVCTVMAMLSVLVFTAAFVIQIAAYARLDDMSTLFGDAACQGSVDVCAQTYRARRFYSSNASPASLWACAVGLTILSFPYERRCRTRREFFTPEQEEASAEAAKSAGWLAVLSALVAIAAVYVFSDGRSMIASVELLLLYSSIPIAWFGQAWIACALHAAGIVTYTIHRAGTPFGYDLTYLTHWAVAATLLATVVLTLSTGISRLLYSSWCSTGKYVAWIESVTALTLIALVSLQLSLTIGSLGIVSGYDGSRFGNTGSWRSTSFQWATQHCISFFFAAALVGGRFECQNPFLPRWLLRTVWFVAPGVLVVCWIVAMATAEAGVPYASTGEPLSLAVSAVAAIVPWTIVGWVLC
jgi:hypothetical protein